MIEIKTEVVFGSSRLAETIQGYRNEGWKLIALTAIPRVTWNDTEFTAVFERQKRGTMDA